MTYISHARTPEELKAEVCSDLKRRLSNLDDYDKFITRSEAEKARVARAKLELESMLHYWSNLEIVRPVRRRKSVETGLVTANEERAKQKLPALDHPV